MRLHIPGAPFGLVRDWTQQAYEDLCERRPWSWTRKLGQLPTPLSRTVTITYTVGSPNITSAGGFQATDVNLQLRVGNVPIYTINTVTDANNAILDQPWEGLSGDQVTVGPLATTVIGMYATMPPDFGAFLLVVDPYNQRICPWWYTQEDLARLDPSRFSTDANPRVLVSRQLSTAPSTDGQLMYEWWPAPTQRKNFPYYYRQRPQRLNDTDPFRGVLASRATLLETGALARAAKWPGTAEQKNPYFNLGLAQQLSGEFDHGCAKLELRDDDQILESWTNLPYHRWATWDLSMDTGFLRSTDATTADYRSFL